MNFKEELQKLSIQVSERKNHITNEEMTKQALIVPFLQVLGFDVFNPLEVRPEYDADFGKKKGEKVDYAIFKDNIPIIFLEAKSVGEELSNHDAQLGRYFNAVPNVKFGIISNGLEYRFFTDLNENNHMDETPFLIINIENLSSFDIENLSKFRKETFNSESLITFAEDLIYTSNVDEMLAKIFKNPSDDFIRFLIKGFTDSRITQNVIDRFRPIVKKSISHTVLDIVSQGLFPKEDLCTTEENKDEEISECKKEEYSHVRKIETTKEELEAFEIIKNILIANNRDITELKYKDTTAYFGIQTKNSAYWFIRLCLAEQRKIIITKIDVTEIADKVGDFHFEEAPAGLGTSRIYINSIEDLSQLQDLILYCFDNNKGKNTSIESENI
ncbi:MAG: type I restriction endonuclease [bacterium]